MLLTLTLPILLLLKIVLPLLITTERYGQKKPMYFQILFVLDQIKEQAASHPDWKTTKPYSLVLSGQIDKLSLEDVLTMVQKRIQE